MFVKILDNLYNLNAVARVKFSKEGAKSVLTPYFSATDKDSQVTRRITGKAADDLWYDLEKDAKDLTE